MIAALTVSTGQAWAQTSSDSPSQQTDRTWYEGLDMSTPETSLRGFLDAFRVMDFPRAFYYFSPEAQGGFILAISNFDPQRLLRGESGSRIAPIDVYEPLAQEEFEEIASIQPLYFDTVMMFAAQNRLLPFALKEWSVADSKQLSDEKRAFEILTGGQPEKMTLTMIKMKSGRWKLDQMTWDGSREDAKPWGLPAVE